MCLLKLFICAKCATMVYKSVFQIFILLTGPDPSPKPECINEPK